MGSYTTIIQSPIPVFNRDTPENLFASAVDSAQDLAAAEKLAFYLAEDQPLYTGRGTNQTCRIRGYILAAFERTGLPESALPYALDELENGNEVYLVAAAAAALRGISPSAAFVPFLLKAVRNTRYGDDSITFESFNPVWPVQRSTTALAEIFKTFAWLGGEGTVALPELKRFAANDEGRFSRPVKEQIDRAIECIEAAGDAHEESCCTLPAGVKLWPRVKDTADSVDGIVLQDQDGETLSYSEFFKGRPSIVVFFYTRCNNPNKCSLTVTKAAHLQKALRAESLDSDVNIAAVTYDPGFDLPHRLNAYGASRGMEFNERHKILRTPGGLAPLQAYFRLGVNFVSSIVNRHRIELFILDKTGNVRMSFQRSQWNVDDVLGQVYGLLAETCEATYFKPRELSLAGSVWQKGVSFLMPLVILFFPKCPLCWAAYLSLFGITGISNIPFKPWLLYPLIVLMIANLAAIYRRSKREGDMISFGLSVMGVTALLVGVLSEVQYLSYLGIVLTFIGSLQAAYYIKRLTAGHSH